MRINPLPPLKSLVAFEAAARHQSFTQAADELCVTQGAVSKQIRLLEQYLGCDLFLREKNLVLTESGVRYYQSTRIALMRLSSATADIVKWQGNNHITIVTSSALASFWLMPRFAEFEQSNPDVDVRIKIETSIGQMSNDDFDLGVFYCSEKPTKFNVIKLFKERVFPVCSPEFLEQNPEIADPNLIGASKLLLLDSNEPWINWNDWLLGCNLRAMREETTKIKTNDYTLVIQAAINGQGVALAWEKLVDTYIAEGKLIAPIPDSLETLSNFYIITPTDRPQKRLTRDFIEFLNAI
ncbi:MAG: LysR substrate-binding domain-containing protein [Arenicella sp.]